MENASKALEIAAGVLLAVLIMTLVAYFFTTLSSWPEREDEEKLSQQTAQFNLEYEVYDKKGMYGADVISCLTKAMNNNEKYYEGGSFLSGQKYGEKYWVNVYVNLKSNLEEQIIVYHLQSGTDSIYKQVLKYGEVKYNDTNVKLGNVFVFKESADGKRYTGFNENTNLMAAVNKLSGTSFIEKSAIVETDNGNSYNACLYKKRPDGSVNTNSVTPLQVLLVTCSTNIKQIVMNTDDDKESLEAWSSAEWRTALYDFKTRRFKCDNIKYNNVTGRVNEIYFSELE